MTVRDESAWRDALRTHRRHKDEYLATDHHSPLPTGERDRFDGLDYFEPDPSYRFEVSLDEYEDKETITIATTTEGERAYLVWGAFHVEIDGEAVSLDAYRRSADEDRLWVPFRDETNGEETYGAGRYLDLDDPDDRTADGEWVLDFNYAYNPFCVYNDRYECPLVPMENWLSVEIRAGEKTYEK
jgi:uncharacterized protein (DUF1684 family)